MSAHTRQLRSQIAHAARYHHDSADDLRRQLKEARLEEYVREVVDSAPPLTIEQRAKIAAILLSDRGDSS